MEFATHRDHLRGDLDRLRRLHPTELHRTVASCPDWDGEELIRHLGSVHRWALEWLTAEDAGAFPPFPEQPASTGAALLDWLVNGAEALIGHLDDDDPLRPVGSFLGPTNVAWWARRQAIETALHRWDAQLMAGQPDPIPADLAADAIEEWFDLQIARGWNPGPQRIGTIHLHGTDAEGEWLIELDGGLAWSRGHQKGDAAVRGTVSDLLLLLWRRVPPSDVDVVGRADVLDRFLASL
jgi:uncharacterized protein (TIGR03083 family)